MTIAVTSRTGMRTTTTRVAAQTATPTAAYNYNYMYPYLNNQMRTDLNPGVTPEQGSNPITAITRTEKLGAERRVVPRTAATSTARSATSATTFAARNTTAGTNGANNQTARSATTTTQQATNTARRVVARSGTTQSTQMRSATARSGRSDASYYTNTLNNTTAVYTSTESAMSSTRCLADYTECMNGYCARENTAYNRCYCSTKLSQIDAAYQTEIDNLIKQIITLRANNPWSDAEMNEYWESTIGKYTGDNSWINLENALNIDWAGLESRVRGSQAFATGHEYCIQHLRGCAYMATNVRDAYRSEIARDCATYEAGLEKIKTAAESVIETYND
ncbi:hypothetical protein HDR66_02955 [bacterium]|nr:hypothetical protein [bacterium]